MAVVLWHLMSFDMFASESFTCCYKSLRVTQLMSFLCIYEIPLSQPQQIPI
uniref:Uncharacterized protein n=1 Tax=Octopus bimaculoides TaxID=37653 RepID=A0A0L8GWZ9_OCTBM